MSASSVLAAAASSPSLSGFDVVIHLNGVTFGTPLSVTAQQALQDFVSRGKGYVTAQWTGYELVTSRLQVDMPNLVLMGHAAVEPDQADNANCSLCMITYTVVPAQADHPLLTGLPSAFTFLANGHDAGAEIEFTESPSVRLATATLAEGGEGTATGPGGGAGILVRNYGAGRVVNFSHAANYFGQQTLEDANIQKLFVNAARWASGVATPRVLLLVDQAGTGVTALVNRLTTEGLAVTTFEPEYAFEPPKDEVTEEIPANTTETVTVQLVDNGEVVGGITVPPQGFGDGELGNGNENIRVTVRKIELGATSSSSLSATETGTRAHCHDYLLGQAPYCIEVTAEVIRADGRREPAVVQANNVIVGVCFATPPVDELQLYKFQAPGDPAVIPLKGAFFPCDEVVGSTTSRNWLEGLALGALKRVGEWILPKPLHAFDLGIGGALPVGGGASLYTWARPIQISHARLGVNVLNSGKDAFLVDGTFDLSASGLGEFQDETGFNPVSTNTAANAVFVGFGRHPMGTAGQGTIRRMGPIAPFRYSTLLKRWVYTAPLGTKSGVLSLSIDPVSGRFTVIGSIVPSDGGLPTPYREFTLQIGHRIQGVGLLCSDVIRVECALGH